MSPERAAGPPHAPDLPEGATAVLEVDLGALAANYRALRARAGRAECAAVVKADAYGTGAGAVAAALLREGCRTFFVATHEEARALRKVAPARDAVIYALDGLVPGSAEAMAAAHVRPVLGSPEEIREWAAFCRARGARLPAAVHVDTGMNRLGLTEREVAALAGETALFDAFDLALVMSHLACADEPEAPMNARQLATFERVRARLPAAPASFANSAGTLMGGAFLHDLVRPGIALYGGRAVSGRDNPMRPVVTLWARILQVRETEAGESVGYGATWLCADPRRIATVAVGYADGFRRHLSGTPERPGPRAFIGAHAAPVVGRVSMDLVMLDVTDLPADAVRRGGWAEMIGARTTIDDLADAMGTIGYEILTGIGPRCHRVHVHGESVRGETGRRPLDAQE